MNEPAKLLTNSIFFLFMILLLSHHGYGQSDCEIVSDGIDMESKIYIKEVAPSLLFNHTPPEVKNELQTDNLINCQAQMIKKDNDAYLHLNLHINSKIAKTYYGEVSQENILKVVLLNGKEIQLKCYAGSQGILNQERSGYIYPLGYKVNKSDMRALRKMEIDKIGIQWSSGYEEYVIYEVDFFLNQLACLNQTTPKPN